MKLPLDASGDQLAHALRQFGYGVSRQTRSHLRLTTQRGGEHHVTIPAMGRSASVRSRAS